MEVDQWVAWQPDITAPHLMGALQIGSRFNWRTGGLRIHSTLHTVEPLARIGWSGAAFGSFAVHNRSLTHLSNGHTWVRVDKGWLVNLLRPVFQRALDSSIAFWLAYLMQTAEHPAPIVA